MSKEQKEEGTAHYRSGIYDVVSAPAKDRRRSTNVLVRNDYDDVLARLNVNVEENTKAIRALHAHLNAGGDRSLKRRSDRVTVYVRVAFLRIIDVDTKSGTYTADVYVQASWLEPALKSATQQDLDDLDYDQVWKPNIIITNLAGTPEHMQRWYGGCRLQGGGKVPLLYLRIALRARFKENLKLGYFPIDSQNLSVTVGSERSEAELNLVEDLATVNCETFCDQSEFTLHHHVEVERRTGHMQGLDIYERSPKLNFSCHVTRRPSFYFWNMFLILFLISGLLFVSYIYDVDETDARMKTSIPLLLIIIAYKLVLVKEMPRIPFMSIMGGYTLGCLLMVVWQTMQNGIIKLVLKQNSKPYATSVDNIMMIVLLVIFILFNFITLLFIVIKYLLTLKTMADKNEQYRNRLQQRGSYDNPAYQTHHYREKPHHVPKNHIDPENPYGPPVHYETLDPPTKRRSKKRHDPSLDTTLEGVAYTDDGRQPKPQVFEYDIKQEDKAYIEQ